VCANIRLIKLRVRWGRVEGSRSNARFYVTMLITTFIKGQLNSGTEFVLVMMPLGKQKSSIFISSIYPLYPSIHCLFVYPSLLFILSILSFDLSFVFSVHLSLSVCSFVCLPAYLRKTSHK